MNKKTLLLQSVILFILNQSPSWAAPPNPTNSDFAGNTAGGTNALKVNLPAPISVPQQLFGWYNTAFGSDALSANTVGLENTAIGASALASNTSGILNTAVGQGSAASNTTGFENTAIGEEANLMNIDGNYNTAIGSLANGATTHGNFNTAIGARTLSNNGAIGSDFPSENNTAVGYSSLRSNNTGNRNTAVGANTLLSNTTGLNNVALGFQALNKATAGSNNIAVGANAGINLTTGSWNIYLANAGIANETNTIRIGTAGHSKTFIGGIFGKSVNTTSGVPVVIDSTGKLGTIKSSARYKKDIHDMADASHNLLKLRPVTYHYKETDASGQNPLEYGLIAEEVEKVYPDLVAYGADGKIETVQYQKLTPMLLNEVQKLNVAFAAEQQKNQVQVKENLAIRDLLKIQQTKIEQQAQEIAGLKSQTQELAQLKTAAQEVLALKQQVAALQAQVQAVQTLAVKVNQLQAGQTLVSN